MPATLPFKSTATGVASEEDIVNTAEWVPVDVGLYVTETSVAEIVPSVASITEGVALNMFASLPEIVIVAEDVRLAPEILMDLL